MEYKRYPNNFLELNDSLSGYKESKVVIIPVPYEKTTTFVRGTKKGPQAMIEASMAIQFYDEELQKDACNVGICTLYSLKAKEKPQLMIDSIYKEVKSRVEDNKFPIILGGEHSITQGCVKAFAEKYGNITVLQLDAHTDLAEEWNGSRFNHACAAKRCFDITKRIVQVGVRSAPIEEVEFAKKNGIGIFWAKDIAENEKWHDKAISRLSQNVYITIDLDGFDPSFMPSVGNPEPGGLQYYPTLRFLKKVCRQRKVVGFDVVELCPNKNNISPDFTAAKLIYKMIGYIFFK
ncbi:agmatinase [Candidatus Woesearchaeota archaeon]|nr:agmatinase [Candidatus Woesearchaeota archaeon]